MLASHFSDPQIKFAILWFLVTISNIRLNTSGVFTTFRELLIMITFLLKSLLMQEYIICCVSLHKSVFPPIYLLCCFSLNTLQYVSYLLIMRFPEHSASFQDQSLSLYRDGLCLFVSWPTVSTYEVFMLPDYIWTHDSCALHYNAWGNPHISLNRSVLDIQWLFRKNPWINEQMKAWTPCLYLHWTKIFITKRTREISICVCDGDGGQGNGQNTRNHSLFGLYHSNVPTTLIWLRHSSTSI